MIDASGTTASPTPKKIKDTRIELGLTRAEAAALIYSGERAWKSWELGDRPMHPGLWELFLIKAR